MTAVSQSYPNYLGGLNEQPDELKKPGQLSEAVNVIPDPVIGLTRRPGFKLVDWKQADGTALASLDADPDGTWFEVELSNQINQDYIYYGCVKKNGSITIFNQDGEVQAVRYTNESIIPHKNYLYNSGLLEVSDDNGDLLQSITANTYNSNGYFRNEPDRPLKYCVSKQNIIFANPNEAPTLARGVEATAGDTNKYYSFINLKLIDTENYGYTFRRFYDDSTQVTYTSIQDINLVSVEDLGDEYDEDLTLPLQTDGPWRFTLEESSATEEAIVEVTFLGQVVQKQSSDSGNYRNEAEYTYSVKIIDPGKGYSAGTSYTETLSMTGKPNLTLKFKIDKTISVTGVANDLIVPDDLANNDSAEEILLELGDKFLDAGIDKVLIVGSGLYLENSLPFSVSTPEIAVADVINSQKLEDKGDIVPIARVNSVAELPTSCYAGFVVQVINSFENENDFYMVYRSESQPLDGDPTTVVLTKSDGYWEEIAKPFEQYNPNAGTLPHMITIARESDQDRFAFIVSPMQYEPRTAGTAKDNPSMFSSLSRITDINYYKNRLFFFTSNGSVISSRAGEINNLFLNTAVTTSLIDPIDLDANSNQRVPIYGSSVVNNAMVLFGESEQYSITTNDSLFTTETVNITKIANYTFDPVSRPIFVGTNIGFISSNMSRFYEMTNIYDRGPVDINERSQPIQTQFGNGFNMPVASREQSMIIVYKKYGFTNSPEMYLYRFKQENSQESSQTAWVKWVVDEPICFVSLPQDKMFTVVYGDNGYKFYKMDTSTLDETFLDGYNDTTEGVPFETKITFPTIYPRGNNVSDITGNLTIHRIKMSTGAVGTYDLNIERKGYDDYKLLVEQTPSDEYKSNSPPRRGEHIETVPIYTKNHNLNISVSTSYDAPLTLNSMTWEGAYNRPYYKRV